MTASNPAIKSICSKKAEMESAVDRKRPNWLFRGLIIISLTVHVVLLMHIAKIYRPKALSTIELTMRTISKPFKREIPRPRFRSKARELPEKVHRVKVKANRAPSVQPSPDTPPIVTVPDISQEAIRVPQIPFVKGPKVSNQQPDLPAVQPVEPSYADDLEFTEEAYRDIIDRKIRSSVKYPSRAKRRNLQGRVTVVVTIGPDGEIAELKITQSSGHGILDRSVLKAVKDAAPFSKPPKGSVTVFIPIQFRLI